MRFVPLKRISPGMVISQDFYTMKDGLVIKEKTSLSDNDVRLLREEDVYGIYVDDVVANDVNVWNVIPPRTRYTAMMGLRVVNYDIIMPTAENIINEIFKQNGLVLEYIETKSIKDYAYAHNINMAIISCAIGLNLHMSRKEIKEVVQAAMLCDIGMSHMDPAILNKTDRLTKEEYNKMKAHAKTSYHLVHAREDLSEEAKNAILHHHENEDGSGYPDGLNASEIPFMAKILHVADVYDAMVSKRPFKEPYTPQEVLEYLMGGCGSLFDKKVVMALSESIVKFPKGTDVLLSKDHVAVVYRNRKGNDAAPVVKTEEGKIVDLANSEYNWVAVSNRDKIDDAAMVQNEISRNAMVKSAIRAKIMVVDDQATNLQVIRDILSDDYDLILLKSGMQALKYFEKNKAPDLILMDINMPELNGIETTRRIHQITGGKVPVLFVSANHDITTVLECRGVGCAGFVMRPYNEVYIKTEVERILEGVEQ